MTYSILSEARVKGSVADLRPSERAYSIFWTRNGNLEGWDSILDLDIVGTWNGFLYGTKRESATGSIGPSTTFAPIDARVNDRIFFRLKYDMHPRNPNPSNRGKVRFTTVSDPIFDDDKSVTFEVFSDGKWHFYELNMNEVSAWVGEINNIQFFPCINGYRNDEFFLNFFEIGTNDFTFSFSNNTAGLAGRAVGATALSDNITITKDSNDKLVVNIDDYGDVRITLTPQTAPPLIIARDISLQLGKVGIGGYTRAEAYIDTTTNVMVIESGIRAADSSVEIKNSSSSAGYVLGFLDVLGNFIGSTQTGTDPDPSFEPLSAYTPTTLEILALFDNDSSLPAFTLDPQAFVVEGGRRSYGTTNRKLEHEVIIEGRGTSFQSYQIQTGDTFDGQSKTLIDINHPFTDNGKLDKVYINGVADVSGASKWKVFRPSLDGTITLVAEGSIGQTPPLGSNEVLTEEPGVYVADVSSQNINVRRGDLLGIYNADLHAGDYGTNRVNAQYYEISGDAQGTITPPTPSGAGEAGLPIYARGSITKNKAVIDIDLNNPLNLDTIKVSGFEDSRDLEYNIAMANSSSFSIDISGNHTICYNPTPITRTCFNRTNASFNVQALNDDMIFAENGIAGFGDGGPTGLGGADAAGASYFYINGDAEWLGSKEFIGQLPERYDFFRDPYGIDCYFSASTPRLDKPIGKAVIYFKDKKNQRSWQLETALQEGSKGGNGSKAGFQLIPSTSIQAVEFDNNRIEGVRGFITTKSNAAAGTILLDNPVVLDTIAANGTRNPQQGTDFTLSAGELGGVNVRDQVSFLEFQWNKFQWEFDSIRTIAFRYYSDFHWSTKISEFQVFAVSESQESLGDNSQILFSSDGETFVTAALLTSGEEEAEYKLGGSPQYLRLIFRPTFPLSISDVTVVFEEDQVYFGEEGRIRGAISIPDSKVGSVGNAFTLPISNNTGETADLILDIPPDIETSRQLLYFSKLHSLSDITTPQIGPPGRIDFTEDKVLKEEENVAINAHCYGLSSLVSGTGNFFVTGNLLTNAGFETGNTTGWDLVVVQSGTENFQIPGVKNIDEGTYEDTTAGVFQTGDYIFGFSIDNAIPAHEENFTPVEFELSQTVDISEFAEQIDTGQAFAECTFRYLTFYSGTGPTVHILGAPTEAGADLPPDSVISVSYGTNTLRSEVLERSLYILTESSSIVTASVKGRLKVGTRFLRIMVDVVATSYAQSGDTKRQKFLSDDYELALELPAIPKARWYKNWRTGVKPTVSGEVFNGWTDASFSSIISSDFVTTTGSTHWYQPFDSDNDTGVPAVGQTQGFSNAFLTDRFKGIQSFRRMTAADPGMLAASWSGEKSIAGFRIMMHHNTDSSGSFSAEAWPRYFQAHVLKTRAELGGASPTFSDPNHTKVATVYRNVDAEAWPGNELNGTASASEGPWSIITTWLFESGPITTEGLQLMFTLNCDKFERDVHANNVAFHAHSGCPLDNQDVGYDWLSDRGIGVGYFVPLEVTGKTDLPIDNVQETHVVNADKALGNVYVAVDLGRHHYIETNSDLFELIATTPSQSEFNTGSVVYSGDNTDDPNLVVWSGSSSNARWVRFTTNASIKYEDPAELRESSAAVSSLFIESIPQAILNQARIYPNITKTLFPTEGYNSSWVDLGTTLSDNKTSTKIYYSDYPAIALDLGKGYIIDNDASVIRKRHDVVGPEPDSDVGSTDERYWDGNSETNWTYSSTPSTNLDLPERVVFRSYGAGVPDFPVRWVAVKGAEPLLASVGGDPPKTYNFRTPGQTLFYVKIKPRSPEIFTENAQWFSNEKAVLSDISTFEFTLGSPFSVADGVDYGSAAGTTGNSTTSTANNLGSPYRAFDGQFDELSADLDIWGVEVRDIITGLTNAADNFPHSIWRAFRNILTGEYETKSVKAIKIRGYNELFYPKTFSFQKLLENADGSVKDPNLNSSWETIDQATFSNVDTFQEGLGFTHVFGDAVSTKGIRIRITVSQYPDDSVVTSTDPDTGYTNATRAQISGPQTRVAEVVIYEEVAETSALTGTIDINHMLSASVVSNTAAGGHDITKLKDGNVNTYWQSTGFSDAVTISLAGERPITRLEWVTDENLANQSASSGTNAPRNFELRGTVGGQERSLVTGSGIAGTSFSGTLAGAPITASNFTFEVTGVQGEHEDASSIIISELRLIEVEERTIPLTVVESVDARRPSGTNSTSTKITYAANADAVAKITADGIDGNNDLYFSERDFFSLWVYINDISLLDTTFGNFKLGNNSETFYRWDFANLNLQQGWQQLQLQFRTADDRSEIEFQPGFQFDSNTGDSKVDFLTADVEVTSSVDGTYSQRIVQAPGIRFFEIEFRGTKGNKALEIILDDFRFIRNRFEDRCRFLPSLYLNNSEIFNIFLEGIDLATGTIEFWFTPDWDTGGRLAANRPIIPALFRIMRPDGKFLSLFYRPNQGFVSMVFDGEQVLQFVTSVDLYRFERFETFHVALVWDAGRRISPHRTSMALYINGEAVFGSNETWSAGREGGATLLLGGEVGQGFAATPDNPTALVFTAVPTQPAKNTASVWGLLENLKIYNYPKHDFSDRENSNLERTQLVTPAEMIEISIDDSNFYGVGYSNLPLVIRGIMAGQSVPVYIRTNIPRNLTGNEQRDASLLVRWKTPLRTCS